MMKVFCTLAPQPAKHIEMINKNKINMHLFMILLYHDIFAYNMRRKLKINPVSKLVDTSSAEFEAFTPYYYSTYEKEDESRA